ncbi:leucine--tRNA ligase [Lacibacter sediminis]|uniref:Leucine--tRNA ligase n=1 Tax=Lacibacter sediminis TaxID=2760713 RepID=A0A7G5XEW7_9BACT|nr:class I tRNA ligase family protein [Lacibacter sediminis]QNA44020.1 leucine--tRNA ligase [Lacibacter sediminis]
MEYKFREIEKKWQQQWINTSAYKVSNVSEKPKFYVLDMFPYPSGAGLHVGHPLGYIASDIYSRFKRLKGFNVLHPMGYDAFGLPAEQYAIEHGVHPAVSTDQNINNFRRQLDNIGFCYDWDREVRTCDAGYYKWTQWIFLQLFNSFYNRKTNKAEKIEVLIAAFEKEGNATHQIPHSQFPITSFTAEQWKAFDEKTKQDILMQYRLAYCGYGEVNWCEALGTVLANDEVVNGVSERGGHPVVKKKLRQWYLRITEYADRLLEGLERIEFSESMKEMQTNWIGKSSGAEIDFAIKNHDQKLRVYTTRPDTIFGVDFMVIAPELDLVDQIKSVEQTTAVDEYIAYVKSRSERERQAEKKISGVFTGAYAVNPFDGREIPIWISEYVLAGYGTGAIMAVPCGDDRDFKFAQHFNIPITNIIGKHFNGEDANATKDATLENSGFLNGTPMREAAEIVIGKLEELGIGTRKVNYRMRDAAFSRQRYWGEPFPIQWKNGTAYPLNETELPLLLPEVDSYSPGPEGEGPLANIPEWVAKELETNTMPGYAGSSWYFLRYMDPHNDQAFCDRAVSDYWNQVDIYIGGTEHAVGHLLYSRMWTKALYDLGHIGYDEPFKKLVNQGMIQGSSRFVYRLLFPDSVSMLRGDLSSNHAPVFISEGIYKKLMEIDVDNVIERIRYIKSVAPSSESIQNASNSIVTSKLHVDVNIVDGFELDIEAFKKWRNGEYANAEFILEDGKYICGSEVEKMSKSKFNTVNPDDLVTKYGADTFRMYEMFLGPVEISKPWDTKGIEGVHRFIKKLWRLFYDEVKGQVWNHDKATDAELKVLHKTIKKIEDDTERFSFNTGVSTFMIAVNELSDLKCYKKEILEQLLILLTPYAPHVSEELWSALGNSGSILDASFPKFEAKYVTESTKDYPVAINGKTRTELTLDLSITQAEVEQIILNNEVVLKWLDGKQPKKIIYVKNKMINVVI